MSKSSQQTNKQTKTCSKNKSFEIQIDDDILQSAADLNRLDRLVILKGSQQCIRPRAVSLDSSQS